MQGQHPVSRAKALLLAGVVAALALAGGFALSSGEQNKPVTSMQFLMNTVVEQELYGAHAQEASEAVEAEIRAIENRTSLFLSGSELSRINKSAGAAPVKVGGDTFALISFALRCGELSQGRFDVTTAPLKELWNITSEHPQVPSREEIAALLPLVNDRDVLLDERESTVFLKHPGQQLDLGGIAKGYAAGRCLELLNNLGVEHGYVSIGGNIAAVGVKLDGEPMRFGIRSPRGGEEGEAYFCSIPVRDAVLATSGDYERFFEQDGVRYHHILDPATGSPARSGLISVSVVCEDGGLADFLSTALFIGGKDYLEALQGQIPYEYIAVDENLNVIVSDGLKDKVKPNPRAPEYRFT